MAELHLLVPQQSQDPSQPQNVGAVIDLPKLTNPDHVLPQEGAFATTGRAQLDDASSIAVVVRAGLVDILRLWGVDNPENASRPELRSLGAR